MEAKTANIIERLERRLDSASASFLRKVDNELTEVSSTSPDELQRREVFLRDISAMFIHEIQAVRTDVESLRAHLFPTREPRAIDAISYIDAGANGHSSGDVFVMSTTGSMAFHQAQTIGEVYVSSSARSGSLSSSQSYRERQSTPLSYAHPTHSMQGFVQTSRELSPEHNALARTPRGYSSSSSPRSFVLTPRSDSFPSIPPGAPFRKGATESECTPPTRKVTATLAPLTPRELEGFQHSERAPDLYEEDIVEIVQDKLQRPKNDSFVRRLFFKRPGKRVPPTSAA
eukprot:CAMPEP_0184659148 /NCGR_PEP_ID=MMETSP0308-20130426/28461_1 /TAXON_ID=38269 /ORGANISM="Gloeochaete witrockiana, Strain SAG 46.84" /LENGTH=286 /DNA_ID=CAMNT_0027098719 /DNA_START=115 /DNA_END=975 /DNA_ORIENTATION=+